MDCQWVINDVKSVSMSVGLSAVHEAEGFERWEPSPQFIQKTVSRVACGKGVRQEQKKQARLRALRG